MKKKLILALLPMAVALAIPTDAQDFSVMLTREQVNQLSEQSGPLYNEALDAIDHVNYPDAIEKLAEAAAADSDHVDLQFLLAKVARGRAEIEYGEESLAYYDMAATAIRRLLSNPALGPEERVRVARESERLTEGREALRARDDERLKTGFNLVMQIHQTRRLNSGLTTLQDGGKSIEDVLKTEETVEEGEQVTKENVWPVMGAPGLAVSFDAPPPPPQGFGGGYGGAYAFDPLMGEYGGGFGAAPAAPAVPPGGDPFGAGAAAPGAGAGAPGYQQSGYMGGAPGGK